MLFVYDLETQVEEQLTFDPALDFGPRWTPDGSQIVFSSFRQESPYLKLWVKDADGSGFAQPLPSAGEFAQAALAWNWRPIAPSRSPPACRSTSATRTVPGSAGPTRTRMACSASICRRGPTSPATRRRN